MAKVTTTQERLGYWNVVNNLCCELIRLGCVHKDIGNMVSSGI